MDSRGYVRHGLYCPDFIVRQHHADQDGPVGHGFRDVLGFDQAEFVDGQVGYVESELLELMTGVEDRVMFDGGGGLCGCRRSSAPWRRP